MPANTMPMTDAEIAHSFRTAANQKNQVKVLADLNCCSKQEMESKLAELGFSLDPPAPKKPKATDKPRRFRCLDETRAMMLYRDGLTDLDMADCLGVSVTTVGTWRRQQGLSPNEAPPGQQSTGLSYDGHMTVSQLQRLLDAIASAHPNAAVCVYGCDVVGVDVMVSMDATGKTQSSRINFRTEEKAHE